MQPVDLLVPSPPASPPRRARALRVPLTDRDDRILRLACQKLNGPTTDFAEAVRALREAVAELIPSGRVYLLGQTARGPILGSLITGVGIHAGDGFLEVTRVDAAGHRTILGRFASP